MKKNINHQIRCNAIQNDKAMTGFEGEKRIFEKRANFKLEKQTENDAPDVFPMQRGMPARGTVDAQKSARHTESIIGA